MELSLSERTRSPEQRSQLAYDQDEVEEAIELVDDDTADVALNSDSCHPSCLGSFGGGAARHVRSTALLQGVSGGGGISGGLGTVRNAGTRNSKASGWPGHTRNGSTGIHDTGTRYAPYSSPPCWSMIPSSILRPLHPVDP